MWSTDYYSAMAQVLPTLLIAVLIELNLVFDKFEQRAGQTLGSLAVALARGVIFPWAAAAGITILIGELLALAVLFFGLSGWLPWVAGPVSALAAVVMVVLALLLPLWRFAK
jgi:hypothetical protein